MRRRKIQGALDQFLSYAPYAWDMQALTSQQVADFIGNKPLYMEIGTGRGGFLVEQAKRHPDRAFIGVELREEMLLAAAVKAQASGVSNLRFIRGDAFLLENFKAIIRVETLYLNFSDPWPKDRHAKRRLTHDRFLKLYQSLLVNEGSLEFKTDNEALFRYSVATIGQAFMLEEVCEDLHALNDQDNVLTEYEDRYASRGHRIYRLKARMGKQDGQGI